MPFYGVVPGVNFTTSAVANTDIDALFIRSGAAVPTRNVYLTAIQAIGKGVNLTNLSGIEQRVKRWTATASSGGTAITPSPRDPGGTTASKATAGQASAGVTSGTGGPVLQLIVGNSASGPGQWSYLNNLDVAPTLEGGATSSLDLFNIAGAVSLVFATSVDIME